MTGRILRAWRRIVVGAALFWLWMALFWAVGHADSIEGVPTPGSPAWGPYMVATIILAVAVAAGAVMFFVTLAPGLLTWVEVLFAVLVLTVPMEFLREAMGLPVWLYCILIGVTSYALAAISLGVWLSRLGRRDTRLRRTAFAVPRPVDEVWSRIVPLPENVATYYWPQAAFLAPPAGSDADFLLNAPLRPGLPPLLEACRIVALDPGRSLTLRSIPLPGSGSVSELRTFRLVPAGAGTRVEVEVTFLDVPLGRRINLWLCNDPREYFASLRAQARGLRDRSILGAQMLPA